MSSSAIRKRKRAGGGGGGGDGEEPPPFGAGKRSKTGPAKKKTKKAASDTDTASENEDAEEKTPGGGVRTTRPPIITGPPPGSSTSPGGAMTSTTSTTTGTSTTRQTPTATQQIAPIPPVRLQPAIGLAPDGTIRRIAVSPLQRTPSPFGARMGDHTVAWAAVVDAVRADLYGKTPLQAVTVLETRQGDALRYRDPASVQGRVFATLPDRDERGRRLADADQQVTLHLTAARAALTAGRRDLAVQELQSAVAQHLALLNYLPYATVPAATARGSTGSNEGRHRQRLLEVEAADPAPNAAPNAIPVRQALWGMFSVEAIRRASGADLVLHPESMTTATTAYTGLDRQRNLLVALIGEYGQGNVVGGSARVIAINRATGALRETMQRDGVPKAILDAAVELRNAADGLSDAMLLSGTRRSRQLTRLSESLAARFAVAERARDDLQATVDRARTSAAEILALLLHDHQRTMVTAYPQAVRLSGFLTSPVPDGGGGRRTVSDSTEAALDHLMGAIAPMRNRHGMTAAGAADPFHTLQDQVRGHLVRLGRVGEPAPGVRGGWVPDVGRDALVVTFDVTTRRLVVNGRAAAPPGIDGMGSHSTSWLAERMAIERTARDGSVADIRRKVVDDLRSEVMKLDVLLPAGQLAGGQLDRIFEAALRARQATAVADAAKAYLEFRNLLPFATVDAGDRKVKGENQNASALEMYDAASLRAEAAAQHAALTDDDQRAVAQGILRDEAGALSTRWQQATLSGRDQGVDDAVTACAGRMLAEADAWDVAAPTTVFDRIGRARYAEHRRVCTEAGITTRGMPADSEWNSVTGDDDAMEED